MKKIIIVGGGIGGLAMALTLAKIGYEISVVDKKPVLTETGAGIQLGPNAFYALDCLGVGDVVRARGIDIDDLIMMDGLSAERVANIPVGEQFSQRFGNPYLVIHRCDLHQALLDACQQLHNIQFFSNQTVVGYNNLANEVRITTQSGDVFSADGVIGADGIYSKIRQSMVGQEPLNVSGHVAYRAVIAAEDMPEALRWNAAAIWVAPNSHIVHYPLENAKTFNIVAVFVTDLDNIGATGPGDEAELRRNMAHFNALPLSLLDVPEKWGRWVLADRDPIDNWTDGNVTLLGDAAHPSYQYFAQGACMALEDAVSLGFYLKQTPENLHTAFINYQQQRMMRAYRVVLSSRLLGQFYHADGMERRVRNAAMAAKTVDDHYNTVQWLYGAKVQA